MANFTGSWSGKTIIFNLPEITAPNVLRYGIINGIENVYISQNFINFNVTLRVKNSAGVITTIKTIGGSRGNTNYLQLNEDIAPYLSNQYPYFELVMPDIYSYGAMLPPQINNLDYVYKTPTVSNVQLSTRYTYISSILTFDVDFFESAVVKIKDTSNNVLLEQTVTTKNLTIPADTFLNGINTVEITAKNNTVYSNTLNVNFTMYDTSPSISILEPNGVNQNLNLPIIVSWTSTGQSVFKLIIGGIIYSGTTATSLTIPHNTLTAGTNTMVLEITHIPTWATSTADYRKDTKTVSFLAYGNPPTPILLNKAIVSSATPLIKWDSSEQVAYEFKLLDGMSNVEVTGEVLSASKQYQVLQALENNKLHTIKLRVKNQYGLWSEYTTSTFTTSFIVPNTPLITGFADISNGSIILNVATLTSAEYKNTEIWRKELYGVWVRMAYNLSELDTWVDNYVKGDTLYQYKARSIGQTGGIAESEPIELSTTVKGYNFYNVEDLSKNISFKYNSEVVPTYKRNEAITMYAGTNAPSYESDNIIYQSLSMKFDTLNIADIDKLIALIRDTKLFLYKDSKGRKVFGQIVGDLPFPTTTNNVTTITFTFIQLSFLEQDVYSGDNTGLKLLMWDGTWMFDATYAFGGA